MNAAKSYAALCIVSAAVLLFLATPPRAPADTFSSSVSVPGPGATMTGRPGTSLYAVPGLRGWLNTGTTRHVNSAQVDFYPLVVSKFTTFDLVSVNVTTPATVTASVFVGVYASDANGFPSKLLVGTSGIPLQASGVKAVTITATTLFPGDYWTGITSNDPTSVSILQSMGPGATTLLGADGAGLFGVNALRLAGSGVLPADVTGQSFTNVNGANNVVIGLRIAAWQ